ncbi:hypothetical protein [Actinomadura kijaniata]|uniref:hypothetical protein n=1 Tax=Actinomadura kijaniata TaxID=46161 RepID=UPI0008326AE7|nr:hypothetical protein [Actinomadura kijaniata]
MISLRKHHPTNETGPRQPGVTYLPPTGHSLTPPPTSRLVAPPHIDDTDDCEAWAADLWELHDQSTRARRYRAVGHVAFAALVAVIGVTLVSALPLRAVWELLTIAATLYGLYMAVTTVWSWSTQHYQWTRTWTLQAGFGYRPRRRWYAPGQMVLLVTGTDDETAEALYGVEEMADLTAPVREVGDVAHVLWWITDPAMDEPWVVIHRDTHPAQVVPLGRLAPLTGAVEGDQR